MDVRRIHDKSKEFVTKRGHKLGSLKDLYGHLAVIDDEEFSHHVNEHKNDFAVWVDHVHGDKVLAAQLRRLPSKDGMRKAIFVAMFR